MRKYIVFLIAIIFASSCSPQAKMQRWEQRAFNPKRSTIKERKQARKGMETRRVRKNHKMPKRRP